MSSFPIIRTLSKFVTHERVNSPSPCDYAFVSCRRRASPFSSAGSFDIHHLAARYSLGLIPVVSVSANNANNSVSGPTERKRRHSSTLSASISRRLIRSRSTNTQGLTQHFPANGLAKARTVAPRSCIQLIARTSRARTFERKCSECRTEQLRRAAFPEVGADVKPQQCFVVG